jgi:hypothetical protein
MSPTCIGGKEYYWINSIFTHKPAKLSENMWIVDIIKDTKPYLKKFDNINIKLSVKNALIIVDNIYIYSRIHNMYIFSNKQYSKKIKYMNGIIYVYDNNYYFFTNSSFKNARNKTYLLNKMRELIIQIKPSHIIDLSFISNNCYNTNSIFQVSSAVMDNSCYKNYKNISSIKKYIEVDKHIVYKTKYHIEDTITIINYNDLSALSDKISSSCSSLSEYKTIFGTESIFISLLLSSEFNIPNTTLGVVYDKNNSIESAVAVISSLLILF